MGKNHQPPDGPAPIVCPNPTCGHVLGRSQPAELDTGSALIVSRVVLKCPGCGKRRTWRPGVDRKTLFR